MSDQIYLIPEIHKSSPFFWAQHAEQVSLMPIPISGVKLYADTKELDSYASLRTIIVVEQETKTSKLYPVRFTKKVPNFEAHGFSIKQCPHGNIVYMKLEDFWKINKNSSFVAISDGDWLCSKKHYKITAALYHLSLLPSLNKAVFRTQIDSKIEEDLNLMYDVSGEILEMLTLIFKNVVFGLEFFGFCNDCSEEQKRRLLHIKDRLQTRKVCVAFSQIDFAILNYNMFCYKTDSCRITSYSYLHLMKTLNIVERIIIQLGFPVSKNKRFESLTHNIKKIQKEFHIPITGICDQQTLQKLWSNTIVKSVQMKSIFKDLGTTSEEPKKEQILIQCLPDDTPAQKVLAENINRFIGKIPITSNASEILRENINSNLSEIAQRCGTLSQRINNIVKRTDNATNVVHRLESSNSRCDESLEKAAITLNQVLEDHRKVQQQFVEIRESITAQKKRNMVLQIFGGLMLLFYLYKFIR
ncbi:hypothetical protein TVAG_006380 [Trichomonas vaginalis G3]|uniref:Uncharacterized protein n=1 Tax=Trichomonas vaginalis (strain ATCC PRA-98 / G3) TaxID=412133 RepID=A2E745_TRIV3|nr:PGBD-like family [Trichomonas vaginalis G3]EAY11563.1 hypothetical protein TVAG_006380 [Trichomonas vaginalis G3]KAI5489447.1 PGBD-like family [Trichomonas vaginalis G3]|eukprot:XP_001323786.1 hypothetical protein [Trichomonas vaginalis G3]